MRINKVVISNYRSIKDLEFHPSDICALVGENNAGKTNILSALDFLLGESWPSRKGLEATDFFNQDITQPIYIEVGFNPNPLDIDRIWCAIPWDGKTETKVEYRSGKDYYIRTYANELTESGNCGYGSVP